MTLAATKTPKKHLFQILVYFHETLVFVHRFWRVFFSAKTKGTQLARDSTLLPAIFFPSLVKGCSSKWVHLPQISRLKPTPPTSCTCMIVVNGVKRGLHKMAGSTWVTGVFFTRIRGAIVEKVCLLLPGKLPCKVFSHVQLPGDLPAPKKQLLHLLKHLLHLHINGRGSVFWRSTFPWETSKFSLFGQCPFRLNMCLFVWRKDSFHLFLHLFLKCDPIETGTTPTSSFQFDASMVGCWFTLVLECRSGSSPSMIRIRDS